MGQLPVIEEQPLAHVPATVVGNALRHSTGRPLEPAVRTPMEHRFGQDFSQVRVHSGEQAASSARDIGALAYTVGSQIAVDRGRYRPGSRAGQHLIAHELAHVVQQRGQPGAGPLPLG
ncbi:MAG: DUF4157 domain-containing protein, partial [Jatrophihabitantaceae bacterium]